ncbi:hypothetical protein DSL92_08395 [Billgrantia gudaonensis]|uniref:Uncharacterized protein n=1 Tax=Billgrantia gudaonensis TaxID=376427 RepID=A0A3S0QFK6_9GAMM|nr:hypothetical protein DSL92_08395 [Halomonas gudaonensis]
MSRSLPSSKRHSDGRPWSQQITELEEEREAMQSEMAEQQAVAEDQLEAPRGRRSRTPEELADLREQQESLQLSRLAMTVC